MKPNILFIMADQLRADALGCYGNHFCRTPNVDALAESGVLFENAFTPNPICVPARASITTGNYSHTATECKDNSGLIHDDQPKLAEHFASSGYKTYACGKLHYCPYSPPDKPRLVHGFDVWDSSESGRILSQFDPQGRQTGIEDYFDYLAEVGWRGFSRAHGIGNNDVRPCRSPLPAEHNVDAWVATRTIARLQEHTARRADSPFLIFCSFPKPHSPYDPPGEYATMYNPLDVPPPVGDESSLADRNPCIDITRVSRAHDSLSPEARRVIKAYYYGLISFQDAQVGRVMNALEKAGVADNTIVVYTADHGDLMGDFGTYFKCCFLQGSVRVPLIISAPGVSGGERRGHLAGLQDILPTLAELAGCPLDRQVHGIDLTNVLRDRNSSTRELFYSQCFDPPRQSAMVTDGRWKYCFAERGPTEELYDLQTDPDELVNLTAGGGADKLLQPWREKLIAEALRIGDDGIVGSDGKLVSAEFDRTKIADLPVEGMGWRWY